MSISPSPICLVNGTVTTNGVDVTASGSVIIALADTTGVAQWNITCLYTDELNTSAAVNSGLVVNLNDKTATFNAPSGLGSSLIFQSKVNNGVDSNGVAQSSYTTTFKISVLTATGLRVAAYNETNENSAAFGWTGMFNNGIRSYTGSAASAGAGMILNTGAYDVVANADATLKVNANDIQINPAFYSQLATASTLVQRTSGGAGVFTGLTTTSLTATTSVSVGTTLGVTGTSTLGVLNTSGLATLNSLAVTNGAAVTGSVTVGTTLGVTGTSTLGVVNTSGLATLNSAAVTNNATIGGTLGVTTSVTSPSYLFTSAMTGISRIVTNPPQADPANWKSATAGFWTNLSLGTKIVCNFDPPQGCTITGIRVQYQGAAAHANLPGTMPLVDLRYYDTASNIDLSQATQSDTSANTAAYQLIHAITLTGLSVVVDKRTTRFHVDITAESGANALVGASLVSVQYTYTRSAGSNVGQD